MHAGGMQAKVFGATKNAQKPITKKAKIFLIISWGKISFEPIVLYMCSVTSRIIFPTTKILLSLSLAPALAAVQNLGLLIWNFLPGSLARLHGFHYFLR